jgi:hypothetical protein
MGFFQSRDWDVRNVIYENYAVSGFEALDVIMSGHLDT